MQTEKLTKCPLKNIFLVAPFINFGRLIKIIFFGSYDKKKVVACLIKNFGRLYNQKKKLVATLIKIFFCGSLD